MKKNMSNADRVIRSVIAVLIAVLFAVGQISGWAAVILGILAGLLLVTGLIGFCPAYVPFGFSTKKDA
jgi:hypothetical protein